jgi:HEAT repeat protein
MNPLLKDIVSHDLGRAKKAEEVLKKALPQDILPQLLELAIDSGNSLAADCACNVVASFRDNDDIAAFLKERLLSQDADVREKAAAVLSNAPQTQLLPLTRDCAEHDENKNIRVLCLHALREYAFNNPATEPNFVPIWLKAIEDSSAGVRGAGYECLSHVRDRKLDKIITRALSDPDQTIRTVYAPFWQKNGGRS